MSGSSYISDTRNKYVLIGEFTNTYLMQTNIYSFVVNTAGILVMSTSYLEADFSALASTIRTRLQKHRSHRLKVFAYKWFDAAFLELRDFALLRLNQAHKVIAALHSNYYEPSATANGPSREAPMNALIHVEEGVNDVVARVAR